MDSLSYGGVKFDIVSTNSWIKTAIMDDAGVDYLYTKNEIDISVIYNPSAAAFDTPGTPGNPPVNVGGAVTPVLLPGQTENALVNWFEGQRRQLQIICGPAVVILSPPNDNSVNARASDANNGPFIKARVIHQDLGTRTWLVNLHIETYTNDNPKTGTAVLLLSNRWKISHDVDNVTQLCVRIIEGDAIFNVGECIAQSVTPDSLREQLFFGVPVNFYRDVVQAAASPDGSRVSYLLIDKERCYNISPDSPARQLRIYSTCWKQQGSVGRGAGGIISSWWDSISTGIRVGGIAGVRAAISAAMDNTGSVVANNLPTYYINAVAEGWGGTGTPRSSVLAEVVGIATDRLGGALENVAQAEMILHQAHHENYARCEITLRFGIESRIAGWAGFAVAQLGNAQLTNLFPASGNPGEQAFEGAAFGIPENVGSTRIAPTDPVMGRQGSPGAPTRNPPLSGGSGGPGVGDPRPDAQIPAGTPNAGDPSLNARGRYMQSLVTQALSVPNFGPRTPPAA